MDEIWVCATCKSINRLRDRACYSCRAPQDEAVVSTGPEVRADRAVANRAVRAYLPSWPIAFLAGGLLVSVALLGVVLLVRQLDGYPELRAAFATAFGGDERTLDAVLAGQSRAVAGLALLRSGLVLLALVSFAAWLSVVTLNVPALGGGSPSRGPVRVFVSTLVPLWNLVKVPGMVQDVMYRLDPRGGGALMVLAAAIGLVGSWFVQLVGTWTISGAAIGALVSSSSLDGASLIFGSMLDQLFALAVVTELMIAGGTLLLVVLMARIERRCADRDREIRAAAGLGAATG